MDVLLIGGVPSSGSSLLIKLLSADDRLLCLPESGLFCHGRNLAKPSRRFKAGSLAGRVPWVDTSLKLSETLGWKIDFNSKQGGRIDPFKILRTHLGDCGGRIVVEKCPENVFAFDAFLSADPASKSVVTSRDLDGVCVSLTRRGFNMLEALLIWFAHTYESWRVLTAFPGRVCHCRYRDIVSQLEAAREKILRFINAEARESATDDSTDTELTARMHVMLDMANWNLEDTAWTVSPDNEIAARATARHLLGLQFDALTDTIAFATAEHGLVQPRVLDSALMEGKDALSAAATSGPALSGVFNSLLTRTLSEVYRPHVVVAAGNDGNT